MAKVRKIDFSPDEFLAGIAGMTPVQGHVYWVVCSLIYSSRRAILADDDRLFAIVKADPRSIRAAIGELVAKGKIERQDGGDLMVRRCRDELERGLRRIQEAAENGSKGGRPRATNEENQPDTKPEAFPAEKLSPSPSPSSLSMSREGAGVIPFPGSEADQDQAAKKKTAEPEGFAEWYGAFPLHKSRAAAVKAYRAALKKVSGDVLLDGAKAYAAERNGQPAKFTKHPATWLNEECWLDEATAHPRQLAGGMN